MAKRERCSKRQIEAMINFIEQHKELIHPGAHTIYKAVVLVLHDEPIACASSNTGHSYGDIQALIQSNNNIATSNNNIARAISYRATTT
ncbi:hypothetical protein QE152_g40084 [Popillia japonica]|uniref:Uncharacterized protein n=1 Tax=Popillia japonica TaxID=7064 RepID=A0AAW1HSY0_POPJA